MTTNTRTGTAMDERARTLAAGDVVWEELSRVLDARPDAILHQPPAPPWTSRDIYAHLARWQAHTVAVVARLRAGEPAPTIAGDDDTVNARWTAEDATLTLAEARACCIASRAALKRALLELSTAEWERFGRRCADDVDGRHYQGHLDAIAAGRP